MKQSRILSIGLSALLLMAAGFAAPQSDSDASPRNPPKTAANAWMQTPTPPISRSADIAAPIRAERDLFWDDSIGERTPLTPGTASRAAQEEGVWLGTAPEIPQVRNRVVLTATFITHRSILSASGRSVYTDVTFHVDEIFQNRSASPITRGQDIDVSLAGGTVLTASGETMHYLTQPRELFVQPDKKYLLVLSYKPSGEFYTLADSWDISDGIVRPNTARNKLKVREGRSSLNGLATTQLENALNQLLYESH